MECPDPHHMPDIDPSNYKNREQAYVKHSLLQRYLPELAYRVGTRWDSLVYVDGFAGPWQTRDPEYRDSSFGVAFEALRKAQLGSKDEWGRDLSVQMILVEQRNKAYERLRVYADHKNQQGFGVKAIQAKFIDGIRTIDERIRQTTKNPFRFVLLDPKGWADIPMQTLGPFIRGRSCEVLINLMTRHIVRFLGQDDRAESYNSLFGRDEVLEILRNTTEGPERVERAVREYCRSLRSLCDFEYVSSAVILEPRKEAIRYFLVYASNHPRGVEVFKAAENKVSRIQDDLRHEIKLEGQTELFGYADKASPLVRQLHQRYSQRARKNVIGYLLSQESGKEIPYSRLFCEGMAFPLVTPNDLVAWLRALQFIVEIRLANPRAKKPSPSQQDRVVVLDRQRLQAEYSESN
jgi:three-Cys-motif partner protein